jgi:hypothetical protein
MSETVTTETKQEPKVKNDFKGYTSLKEKEIWTNFINSIPEDQIPELNTNEQEIKYTAEGDPIFEDRTLSKEEEELEEKKHEEYCNKMHNVTCKFSEMVTYPYSISIPEALSNVRWLREMYMYFHESGISQEAYQEYQAEQQNRYEYEHYKENQEPDIDEY